MWWVKIVSYRQRQKMKLIWEQRWRSSSAVSRSDFDRYYAMAYMAYSIDWTVFTYAPCEPLESLSFKSSRDVWLAHFISKTARVKFCIKHEMT